MEGRRLEIAINYCDGEMDLKDLLCDHRAISFTIVKSLKMMAMVMMTTMARRMIMMKK